MLITASLLLPGGTRPLLHVGPVGCFFRCRRDSGPFSFFWHHLTATQVQGARCMTLWEMLPIRYPLTWLRPRLPRKIIP